MRIVSVVALSAFTVAASAISAGAAPLALAAAAPQTANVVQVSGGCGWGMHRHHGYCAGHHPRPYAYYHRGYAPYPYSGGGYGPMNHPTSGDHVANELNARQLGY